MEIFSALMILLFLQQENVFFSLQIKWHLLILSTGRDTSMVCNLSIPQQNRCLYFHWIRSTLYESGSFTRWLVIRIKLIFQMYLPDSVSCMGGNVFIWRQFWQMCLMYLLCLSKLWKSCTHPYFLAEKDFIELFCHQTWFAWSLYFVALELMTG